MLLEFFIKKLTNFVIENFSNIKGLKKKILKEKFLDKKKRDQKRTLSIKLLLKEWIELKSRMLNLMIIGASKILPICNLQEDFIKEEEIIGFFKFVRFYSGKLSFRVL